jgi:hypothetical protein
VLSMLVEQAERRLGCSLAFGEGDERTPLRHRPECCRPLGS